MNMMIVKTEMLVRDTLQHFSKEKIKDTFQRFSSEEEGIALTEYLILLGLLVGAVIIAVLAFGATLGAIWLDWVEWFSGGNSKDYGEVSPVSLKYRTNKRAVELRPPHRFPVPGLKISQLGGLSPRKVLPN